MSKKRHEHACTCQKWFPILDSEYDKTELSYNPDFLHMGRNSKGQQLDKVIPYSLTDCSWVLVTKLSLSVRLLDSLT